jgi:hypothetical protein
MDYYLLFVKEEKKETKCLTNRILYFMATMCSMRLEKYEILKQLVMKSILVPCLFQGINVSRFSVRLKSRMKVYK